MPNIGTIAIGLLLYDAVFGDVEDVPLGRVGQRLSIVVARITYH